MTRFPFAGFSRAEASCGGSGLSKGVVGCPESGKAHTRNSRANSGVSWQRRAIAWIKDIIWGISVAIIVFVFVFCCIGFVAKVSSGSMEPTLMTGSRIVISRFQTYGSDTKGLGYGDVAAFMSDIMTMAEAVSWTDGTALDSALENVPVVLIKRVVGLPGDSIRVDCGKLYRNGVLVDEPYVVYGDTVSVAEFIVPEGEFFVMGDNRANSYDGRFWEPHTVSFNAVIGEVTFNWGS